MTVRELVLKLLLDSRGVVTQAGAAQQSLDQVSTAADRAGNEMKAATDKGADGFEKLAGVAKRALAVIGGVAFLKSTAAQYFANAAAVGLLSKALNKNTEDMQAWGQAAARSGGSAESFYGTLDTLNQKTREAAKTGGGEAAGVLRKLGISPRENGKVKDTTKLLLELSDMMKGMDQQKAMDYGKALGIDPGTIMLLQSGRREVENLVKRQKELFVYTKEDAEIAIKANNAFADMGQAAQGVAAIFMRVAGPAITWLSEKVTAIAVWMRKNEPFVIAFFTGLAAVIATVALPAIKAFAGAILAAIAPFTPLILIVGALAIMVDDLIHYIRGGKSAFSDLWRQFGTGEEIAEKLRKAWAMLQEAGKRLFSFLISAARTAFQVLGGVIDVAVALYRWFQALINLDFEGMSSWGGAVIDAIDGIISAVIDLIAEFLDMIGLGEPLKKGFTAAADAVMAAWKTVRQWFENFFGWVKETWESVKSIPGEIADGVGGALDSAGNALSSGLDSIADFFGFGSDEKSGSSNVDNSKTITRSTHIGQVVVNTQATDAQGIANGMGNALTNRVNQADGAYEGG